MTYEPIERAQKYLKDINEQLEQLKNIEWFTPNFESPISDEDVEE